MTNIRNENLDKIIDISIFTYEQKLFLLRTLYAKLIRILETFFSGCFGLRNETLSETEKEAALTPLRTSWRRGRDSNPR